jgi:hypothetical protein
MSPPEGMDMDRMDLLLKIISTSSKYLYILVCMNIIDSFIKKKRSLVLFPAHFPEENETTKQKNTKNAIIDNQCPKCTIIKYWMTIC